MYAQILTLIIYFIIILGIGFWAYIATENHSDYVLGSRKLGSVVTALGVGASDMSGWLMLGLPGAVYVGGLSAIWMPIGLAIGAYINWTVVARRLRIKTEQVNALTIPAFFSESYNSHKKILRFVTAGVILIAFTFYSAAGFVAGATLFTHIFDVNYTTALLISAPIIIIYTSVGGFLAVNWVDVLQGFLMLLALLLVPIITIMHLGGWQNIIETYQQTAPLSLSPITNLSFISIISLLGWGLGYFGQPHILVRFMASSNAHSINKAKIICMSWMITALIGAILIGFVGKIYFIDSPLDNPEAIFLKLSSIFFNPWIAGILFAAVLSSIMSTIAAQLLLCATSLVEDAYHSIMQKKSSDKSLIWLERLTVIIVSIFAVFVAYKPNNSILSIVSHAWAGLGAAFGPAILFTLFSKKTSPQSILSGVLSGGLTVVFWLLLRSTTDYSIFDLYEIIPGFLISTFFILFWHKNRS